MKTVFIKQFLPVILTVFTFLALSTLLYGFLLFLNTFFTKDSIILDFKKRDILLGILIYLKTAIDFAILIENLMHTNPGWQKRIAIGFGTALGNALGTFLILIIWVVLKDVLIFLTLMIFIASIILLRMSEESFEGFLKQKRSFIEMKKPVGLLQGQLNFVNKIFRPVLKFVVPNLNLTKTKKLSFVNLIVFSLTVPFVLGIDNFAGYIPFYETINVFGFSLGILLGHMFLTIGLFIFPKKTVAIVKHPIVLMLGGLAFVGLGIYGLFKVFFLFTFIVGSI